MLMSANIPVKEKPVKRQLFPEKLWDLVNKPSSGIQWSPDGRRIEVERTQLEKFIGTKFRSQNFDSFIRQLHFYGFRKCGNSYHHDKFQRGKPDALHSMKRKYSNIPSLGGTGSICQSPSSVASACSPVRRSTRPTPAILAITQSQRSASINSNTLDASTKSGVRNDCAYDNYEQPSSNDSSSYRQKSPIRTSKNKNNIKNLNKSLSNKCKNINNTNSIKQSMLLESKQTILYSLISDYDTTVLLDKPNNFKTENGSKIAVRREGNSLICQIPDDLNLHLKGPKPHLLVVNWTTHGQTSVLSAHYVYKYIQVGQNSSN